MNIEPKVVSSEVHGTTARLNLEIDPTLSYFDGHFDGRPILPGVVQIQWSVEMARRYLHMPGSFAGIDVVKFMDTITPGDQVQLELTFEQGVLQFVFRRGLQPLSKGKMRFS